MSSCASGLLTATLFLAAGASAYAQTLSGEELIKALRQGGCVIVMRHASSPPEVPANALANPDNVNLERQLDQKGRATAAAMGKAFRDLRIPVGDVFSSPTYRALETIRLAGWPNPKTIPELGDNGRGMQGSTEAQAAWLRKAVTQFPARSNTILVTHLPNLTDAFPRLAAGLEDGEALIFGPDGQGGARPLARVKIDAWPALHL